MLKELLLSNRSYRRFDESYEIPREAFVKMAEAIRLTSSAGNLQRIRVLFVGGKEERGKIFETLGFAAYLKDWNGPKEGERPTAYAVILATEEPVGYISFDAGLATQSLLLTAREMGLGGCIFASFSKERVKEILGLSNYYPVVVVALGKPAETVKITDVQNGDVKYYRNELDEHIVPKLSVSDISLRPL